MSGTTGGCRQRLDGSLTCGIELDGGHTFLYFHDAEGDIVGEIHCDTEAEAQSLAKRHGVPVTEIWTTS